MKIYDKNGIKIHKLKTRRVSTFILQSADKIVLWDTSMTYEKRKLLKDLKRLNVTKLDAIFVSHAHTDHVANVASLAKKFGCDVFVHKNGLNYIREGMCPVPKGTNLSGKFINVLVAIFKGLYDFRIIDKWKGVKEINQNVVKELLGDGIELMETFGHTNDSISLIIKREIALVGDIFVNVGLEFYPPFADFPELIVQSWKNLEKKGCRMYYPGHGDPVTLEKIRSNIKKGLR